MSDYSFMEDGWEHAVVITAESMDKAQQIFNTLIGKKADSQIIFCIFTIVRVENIANLTVL